MAATIFYIISKYFILFWKWFGYKASGIDIFRRIVLWQNGLTINGKIQCGCHQSSGKNTITEKQEKKTITKIGFQIGIIELSIVGNFLIQLEMIKFFFFGFNEPKCGRQHKIILLLFGWKTFKSNIVVKKIKL